ncbi:SOS response-associated peptidase [Fictibacillus iocasae]|uniref:Abasic site processing protein n=1 Tax=Fictibacillus iocasae TaxID=2715437 RepID=A0ABW2NUQ8_9BACL
MCGRYMLYTEKEYLLHMFDLSHHDFLYEPRYNIAPGQDILCVVASSKGNRAGYIKWGFVPEWAGEGWSGKPLINARIETAAEKASFKHSFSQRRCLIPANGFYEWRNENGHKQPYRFTATDQQIVAFAGIWSKSNKDNHATCAILTKESDSFMQSYHHRMPLVLSAKQGQDWLKGWNFEDFPDPRLETAAVSSAVNNTRNDTVECIQTL